jgi:drug/metabolite transporter (DMT)-like permease
VTPYLKGLLITLAGVAVITPDTLLVRLMAADGTTILFWRGIFSGAMILGGMWLASGKDPIRQVASAGLPGLWLAAAFAIGTWFFLYSVTHTLVANTLFIVSTSPIFSALFGWVFLGERPGVRTWATIAVTLVGIAIIAYGSASGGQGNVLGDAAALVDAVLLAATFTIARARKAVSMVPAMGLAGVLSAGLALAVGGPVVLEVARPDWPWMAILGFIVAPVGFALLTTGPRYLPAPDVSLLLLLEAVAAPILVWLAVGEKPGSMTLVGGGLIVGALAVSNAVALMRRRPLPQPATG